MIFYNYLLTAQPNSVTVTFFTLTYKYEGEVDESNEPHGFGVATTMFGEQFSGFWLRGLKHGICK